MSYSQARWIEADNSALEIQVDNEGHCRFVVHQRGFDGKGLLFWTSLHTSGLYADADSAEADGWLQLDSARSSARSGMTVNERLLVFGLLSAWDQAIRARDRKAMASIMAKVDLSADAEGIIDAVLAR